MIIIAKYKENINWVKGIDEVAIIEKEVHLPNKGREASSYLFFIIANYETLPEEMIFCQGNPFDHCGFFIEEIKNKEKNYFGTVYKCDNDGYPHHTGLKIDEFVKKLGLKTRKEYKFKAGSQFRLTRDEVRKRSFEWYMMAYQLSMDDEQAPWIFERIWPLIFKNLKI